MTSTAYRCRSLSRNSVSGTPRSLLRLPSVTRTSPRSRRIAAIISFTVVLPLLPVTPITGKSNRARHAAASLPSAMRVSGTTICGSATSCFVLTIAATAPCAAASETKLWPSCRSPLLATYKSPPRRRRLSLPTDATSASGPCSTPVAAAAEHAPEAAAAVRAERGERLLERGRRVGVIDYHERRGAAAETLHAPCHRVQSAEATQCVVESDAHHH